MRRTEEPPDQVGLDHSIQRFPAAGRKSRSLTREIRVGKCASTCHSKERLKLIPQLGCLSSLDLKINSSGKSGLEQEADYFGKLMDRYPNLNVEYQGRPLMLIFMGVTPTNPLPACPVSDV